MPDVVLGDDKDRRSSPRQPLFFLGDGSHLDVHQVFEVHLRKIRLRGLPVRCLGCQEQEEQN
jgi:hypothetical protein